MKIQTNMKLIKTHELDKKLEFTLLETGRSLILKKTLLLIPLVKKIVFYFYSTTRPQATEKEITLLQKPHRL